MRLAVIANLNAKIFREKKKDPGAIAGLVSKDVPFYLTKNLTETESALREIKKNSCDILGILGGDGTLRVTLSKLIEIYEGSDLPAIALLRGGTMNTVSTSLNIKNDPASLLKTISMISRSGIGFRTVTRNLLRVDDGYGFIFGNGFFHSFLKVYHEKAYPSRPKGFFLLAGTVLSAFFGTKACDGIFVPFSCKISVDGQPAFEGALSSVTCSSVPYIGYGFSPYARALEKEGSFHLLAFPTNPASLAIKMPTFFFGRPFEDKKFFQAVAKTAVIETSPPSSYQLDGDLFEGKNSITVSTGPALRFLVY